MLSSSHQPRMSVLDESCSHLFLELMAEDRIAIAQQVTGKLGKGKCLSQLLDYPFRGRVGGRKARYEEPSNRISNTTIDRERIFRWERTHGSHERFSRRKWDWSLRCRRSAGCTTATNDGLFEKVPIQHTARFVSSAFEMGGPHCLSWSLACIHRRISFTRLQPDRFASSIRWRSAAEARRNFR